MDTTDDVTTRSPKILMIEGREYVLYQGFLERIQIADVKLLWLNTVQNWLLTLFAVLIATDIARPDSGWWFFGGGYAAFAGSAALSVFMRNHDVLVTPSASSTKDGDMGSSTLAVAAQSGGRFYTGPNVIKTVTVHPEMENFLLDAFAEGQPHSFRQRPRVQSAFTMPSARRQAWASNAGSFVGLLALASIVATVVLR